MTVTILTRAKPILALVILAGLSACDFAAADSAAVVFPNPKLDTPLSAKHGDQIAVFSGGCFWGVEAVFEHVKGVKQAWSGYAGGNADTAHYEVVSTGTTGHAESVKVLFDPAKISYGQLLKVFFSVAHNPTQLNRQGPDRGTQYRSAIFYSNATQQKIANAYIMQLQAAKFFPEPIVTQVTALKAFYPAEDYHQNYARIHPDDLYIVYNDLPKVEQLKQQFPALYTDH